MGVSGPAPERLVRYRWAAEIGDGGHTLDAACGAGWGTAALAGTAREAIGVDLSPAAIAAARREYGEVADFVEGDLLRLPFADGEFDRVVCFETLAHVAEPETALAELCRVTRAGGMLFVSTPNPAAYPSGNPLHLSETAPQELDRFLRRRFANVTLHFQQTFFASLLGGAELLAHEDPEAELAMQVTKLVGESPASALHAVAVASDAELPTPPARLALGDDAYYRERQQSLWEWQERAVRAEAEVCALERKLRELQL